MNDSPEYPVDLTSERNAENPHLSLIWVLDLKLLVCTLSTGPVRTRVGNSVESDATNANITSVSTYRYPSQHYIIFT